MTENILTNFFMAWTDPQLMLVSAIGVFAGIFIGAIPGLSVTMAVSILISFTFAWDIDMALALMVGVFCGGVYGGSRSAVLLNIPGAPSAVASAFDGYPLAQRGEAGRAIALATIVSVMGGFVGVAILAAGAPALSQVALLFAQRDYMLLALIGLFLVASLSTGSTAKGLFCGALGVMIGTVGMDPMTAQHRFTFDNVYLLGGVHFVVAMIGFFGVAEALYQIRTLHAPVIRQEVRGIMPDFAMIRRHTPLAMRSSLLGSFIGMLPGAGGDIASLLAYGHAKRSVKNPSRPFGQGAYEGVVAPEAANNGAVGGAYIPMLTLGIPGDAVTAVIIGALFIHGLQPGPLLLENSPHLFWFTVGNLALANIFLLIFGLIGIRVFTKIVEVPRSVLLPLIIVLSIVGTYTINSNIYDIYLMLGFGILGYFFKVYGYPVGPIILGVILGPLLERSFRRTVQRVNGDLGEFLLVFLANPISLVLTLALVSMVVMQTRWGRSAAAGLTRRMPRRRPRDGE